MNFNALFAVICTVVGSVLLLEPGSLTSQQEWGTGILIGAVFSAWLSGVEL